MRKILKQRSVLFVLTLFVLVIGNATTNPNFDVVEASRMLDDWGEPCSLPHPVACYNGSNEGALQLIPGLAAMGLSTSLSDPVAVEMLCFSSQGSDQQVNIDWQPATAFSTVGFYLQRRLGEDGSFEDISGFIPHCDYGGLVGGYYLFTDLDVTNGNTYYYQLREVVGSSGADVYHGTISTVPGPATATPTPSQTSTPTPTNTPGTPTATDEPGQPSRTPTLTSTNTPGPSPTFSATPSPTSIDAPTATPTPSPSPVQGSTFTPTPASTNTRLPTATRRVSATLSTQTETTAGQALDPSATNTPLVVAQVGTPISGSAYPGPVSDELTPGMPAAYPGPANDPPTAVPFPTDYVPPATHQSFQMATMTPTQIGEKDAYPVENGEDSLSGDGEAAPRLWLYVGFFLALLALAVGLMVMVRVGQKTSSASAIEPELDQEPDNG